jgi:hypothetical protein
VPTVRTLLTSGLLTASLIAALAVPGAAADTKGTLAIVNGIPGKAVDICINGNELKSKLPYGKSWTKAIVATGAKKLRFYKPDPRRCRGQLLSQKSFALGPGDDLTIVATPSAPKVVVFSNAGLGEIPPLGTPTSLNPFAIRHAASPAADLSYDYWDGPPANAPIFPSAIFSKGQEYQIGMGGGFLIGYAFQFRATIVGSPVPVDAPVFRAVQSHRTELILVGTKRANARWVLMDRLVSQPTP